MTPFKCSDCGEEFNMKAKLAFHFEHWRDFEDHADPFWMLADMIQKTSEEEK